MDLALENSSKTKASANAEHKQHVKNGNPSLALGTEALFFQAKLTVGSPNDPLEHEADAMADKVMRMPDQSFIQRKCSSCDEEEKAQKKPLNKSITPFIQKKFTTNTSQTSDLISQSIQSSRGSGSRMDNRTKSFMSERFGNDFSRVNIHTNSNAVQLSQELNAKAFTVGNDIYFNEGQYQPTSSEGKHLLAHELTHTLQQGGAIGRMIQKTPSAEEIALFDDQATIIRAHPAYKKLPHSSRQIINKILTKAKKRDNWKYYSDNLLLLLNTPDAPKITPKAKDESKTEIETDSKVGVDEEVDTAPEITPRSTRQMNEERVNESLSAERSRLFYPEGSLAVNSEEEQTLDTRRVWTKNRGRDRKIYRVDARDAANIFVKIKVRLKGKNMLDISNVKELEDGIEKKAATFGYTVNLEFVEKNGKDVFNVGVDLSDWTTSANWANGVDSLAHELHHLMGLDDRYNYIDSHAANADMDMDDRIYWFGQQMDKSQSVKDSDSIMNNSARSMQTDDLAGVAHISEASIIAAQQKKRDLITDIRRKAAQRVSIAYLRVNGTNPNFDRNEQLKIVRGLIKPDITDLAIVTNTLSRMHSIVMGGTLEVGPEIEKCKTRLGYVIGNRVPIHLCSTFFESSEEQQIRTIIHEAAHTVGIGQIEDEAYFTFYDCTTVINDSWDVADAWARYINCNSGQPADLGEVIVPKP